MSHFDSAAANDIFFSSLNVSSSNDSKSRSTGHQCHLKLLNENPFRYNLIIADQVYDVKAGRQ